MPTATPKRQLLTAFYPDVEDDVAALIAKGSSWRQIAEAVAERSGVTVSHETLRQWFGEVGAA